MLKNAFRCTFDISTMKPGDVVYLVKDPHATLLIGHSFHKSLEFDAVTLEAKSIIDGHLLARVERIKHELLKVGNMMPLLAASERSNQRSISTQTNSHHKKLSLPLNHKISHLALLYRQTDTAGRPAFGNQLKTLAALTIDILSFRWVTILMLSVSWQEVSQIPYSFQRHRHTYISSVVCLLQCAVDFLLSITERNSQQRFML
ncbi:hypothetical protein STSR3_29 [Salmonella virus STSR3]|nr:hypothetical protein STSR3_29 [Salmonella virus STSR3]